ITSPHSIAVRTYERGVEAETLACGSGVVASAVTAARLGLVSAPVTCVTRSGVAFTVALADAEGGLVEASLTGDAREIYEAELNEEAWQEGNASPSGPPPPLRCPPRSSRSDGITASTRRSWATSRPRRSRSSS